MTDSTLPAQLSESLQDRVNAAAADDIAKRVKLNADRRKFLEFTAQWAVHVFQRYLSVTVDDWACEDSKHAFTGKLASGYSGDHHVKDPDLRDWRIIVKVEDFVLQFHADMKTEFDKSAPYSFRPKPGEHGENVWLYELRLVKQCEHCLSFYLVNLLPEYAYGRSHGYSNYRFNHSSTYVSEILLALDSAKHSVHNCQQRLTAPVRTVSTLSESPIEELFWRAHQQLQLEALRGLVQQHTIGPYRVDFAVLSKKIAIELDGYAFHSDRAQFTRDRERHRWLELHGWRVVRFSGAEVKRDPGMCVREAAKFVVNIS